MVLGTTRPSTRIPRATKRALDFERGQEDLKRRGVLKDPAAVAAKAKAESRQCPRCGKPVHPDHWLKHMNTEHPGQFAPLHESDMGKVLPIVAIRRDGGTQPREGINESTVKEYAEDMQDGTSFPAVTVFYDGSDYWLADGYHRLAAAERNGQLDYPCDVRQGTQREAILHSVGANADHGLRRSNADKRRAVMRLLTDPEWNQTFASDNSVAKQCRVSHTFVTKVRASITCNVSSDLPTGRPVTAINGSQQASTPPLQRPAGSPKADSGERPRTYIDRWGNTTSMNTANIGKKANSERRINEPDGYVPDVPEVVVDDEWEPTIISRQPTAISHQPSADGQELVRPAPLFETKVKMIDTPLNGKTMAFDVVGTPIKLRPGGVYRVVFYEILTETPPPNPLPAGGEGETSILPSSTRAINVSGMPALTPVKVQVAEGQD